MGWGADAAMSKSYVSLNFGEVRTVPLASRPNKVSLKQFGRFPGRGASFRAFLSGLPDILAGRTVRRVVEAIVQAHRLGKPVIWAMGAHVIKCGLSPFVLELMRRRIITAVALNGAAAIHDFEIALIGETSEDVSRGLRDGSFGMADDTGRLMNEALAEAGTASEGPGMGALLGKKLQAIGAPYQEYSILAQGLQAGLPVTVHVAIGTDIVHMHPTADGRAIGNASFRDFRLLASVVADIGGGGVHLNVGSAVVLPEVFLKAVAVARNLGYPVSDFTTVNLDMLKQYRAMENVVRRPTEEAGQGFALIGHHEILIPLLVQAVIEELGDGEQ